MFTGIVVEVGTVASVSGDLSGRTVEITCPQLATRLQPGSSVAVNGVCLTAVQLAGAGFLAELTPETLLRTSLQGIRQGDQVNLEPALRIGDELGGHFTQGHVDDVGRVLALDPEGNSVRLVVSLGPQLRKFVAYKGSVAVDGVSLTVAEVGEDQFGVALIPETLRRTIAGRYRVGQTVNLEVDFLARYLESLMGSRWRSHEREEA